MELYRAKQTKFTILYSANNVNNPPYPYLRAQSGDKNIYCISPNHGRSYIIGKGKNRYVVSKGNGLSYSQFQFLHSGEFGNDTWGLLLKQDAIRDFVIGQEISSLGIKTNVMEYVLELNETVILTNGCQLKPILLQYTVECPYRICDAPFMTRQQIVDEINKWECFNNRGYDESYMIAANVLIRNLKILHDNNVLHNAIHSQNYTWALELLDFELACTPKHPYTEEDAQRHVKDLFPREIIQTYEVINYIAWCLNETIDYQRIDRLFCEYGFNLSEYKS